MKVLIGIIFLISSLSLSARTDINVGKGPWICSAENNDGYPFLAREETKLKAMKLVKQYCADYEASDQDCNVKICEKDNNSKKHEREVSFSLHEAGIKVIGGLNDGGAKYQCLLVRTSDSFLTSALTKFEAKVLLKRICIDNGNQKTQCDKPECKEIKPYNFSDSSEGSSGGLGIFDTFRNIGGLAGRRW